MLGIVDARLLVLAIMRGRVHYHRRFETHLAESLVAVNEHADCVYTKFQPELDVTCKAPEINNLISI
jgi:hypothetical protein